MQATRTAIILGISLIVSTAILGFFFEQAVERYRTFERTIQVKGLAEREVEADTAIWPIQHSVISNELNDLYTQLENQHTTISDFLQQQGFSAAEITLSQPIITDKKAQNYGNYKVGDVRFTATQTVTVYTAQIDTVLDAQSKFVGLGKKAVLLAGDAYSSRTQFLYSDLNAIKPDMIEDATQKAREVAVKFASDSDSQLGKIKLARQGQFSIADRDSNTPHIKRVRVVSTIEYYLVD